MRPVAGGTHHRDDPFDLWRIGRITQILVARRMAGMKARQRGRRSTSAGTIEQHLGHDPSSGSLNEPDSPPESCSCLSAMLSG